MSPMPWETEPTETYAVNQPKFPTARYTFDQRTQDLLAQIRGTTNYAAKPTPAKGPLEEGLSWLGRPLEATTSAVGAGLRGGDVGGEFVRGLQGMGQTKDWTQLLEQQGAPEMGRLQLGPLDVKGRDVLGFAANVALDPLNLVPISPIYKGVKGALLGKTALEEGARLGAKGGLGLGQTVAEGMAENYAPSFMRTLFHKIAKIPGMEATMNVVDPRILADSKPARMAAIEHERVASMASSVAARDSAALSKVPFDVGLDGGVKIGGRNVGIRDIAEDPSLMAQLNPEQAAWVKQASDVVEPLHAELLRLNGGRFVLRPMEEGAQYFPSRAIKAPREFVEYQKIPVGGKKTFEHELKYKTQEEGMAAKQVYADPITTLRKDIEDSVKAIADEQFRQAIAPFTRSVDRTALLKLQGQAMHIGRREKIDTKIGGLGQKLEEVTAERDRIGATLPADAFQKSADWEYQQAGGANFTNPLKGRYSDEVVQKAALATHYELADLYASTDWWQGVIDPSTGHIEKAFKENLDYFTSRGGRAAAKEIDPEVLAATRQYSHLDSQRRRLERQIRTAGARWQKEQGLAGLGLEDIMGSADIKPLVAKEQSKIAKEIAQFQKEGFEAIKGQSIFKNIFAKPEDAKLFTQLIGAKPPQALQMMSKVAGSSRTVTASFDFGAAFLQGIPLLATDPAAWARVTAKSLGAFFKPEMNQQIIAKYAPYVKRLSGVRMGSSEFTDPLQNLTPLGERLTAAVPLTKGPVSVGMNVGQRFGAAFDAFGNGARGEMAKSLVDMAERTGTQREVADFINKSTGIMNTQAMGISPTQRAVESSMIFFSPQYTRATLALVGDLLETGKTGELAREAITSMLMGGTLMYMKIAKAMGQEPDLNPENSTFMTVKMGNDNVGIGSAWISLVRLLARSAIKPETRGKLLEADPQNPLISWWRGRSGPVGGIISDLITGENYFGEDVKGLGALAQQESQRMMPFALSSYVGPGVPADIRNFPAQMLGMRNYPQNFYERRDQIAKEQTGQAYDTLGAFEQQKATAATRDLGIPIKGDRNIRQTAIFDTHNTDMEANAQALIDGKETREMYRKTREELFAALATRLKDLKTAFPETPEQEAQRFEKLSPREKARANWLDILGTKDETGQPEYEAADSFLASLPQEIRTWIDETTTANIKNLGGKAQAVEVQLRIARNTLRPYWKLQEDVLQERGLADEFNGLSPVDREAFMATPKYKMAERIWTRRREIMKRQNKDVAQALVDWYGNKPRGNMQPSPLPSLL